MAREEPIVQIHRAGWARPSTLRADRVASLAWPELMEAHRAACMALYREQGTAGDDFDPMPATGPLADVCRATTRRLLREDSPYRPRRAAVWQRGAGDAPTFEGTLTNASVSHLGSLEVIELDAAQRPTAVRLIPFADIGAVALRGDALYRAVRVELRSGEHIVGAAPLLYATSFESREELLMTGSMTRFVCHLHLDEAPGGAGIGVGQQDFAIDERLFGIDSVEEIHILD